MAEMWPFSQRTSELLSRPPVPARRPRKGDAKVRTGVRRRSGCVTGAGGEASKARNAEVRLRAGWRLRRPASPTRRQPTLKKRSAVGQCGLRFFSRYSGGGVSRKKARPHRPHAVADTRPNAERRRRTPGGREQVSGRVVGCTQAAVALLDGGGFATARDWPDMHLPAPRPGANPARQDAMSRRTRQTAQPVHAVNGTRREVKHLRPFLRTRAGYGSGILLLPPVNARMRVHARVHAASASPASGADACGSGTADDAIR